MKEMIIVGALILWMLSAIAETQAYGRSTNTEAAIQNETSGVDGNYQHGHWCVDARSF